MSMARGHMLPGTAYVAQVRRSLLFWNWRVLVDVGNGPAHLAVKGSSWLRGDAVASATSTRRSVAGRETLTLGGMQLVTDSARWTTLP